MTLETLQKDMMAAMKARDKQRKDSISVLVGAVKKAAIDAGCRENPAEELVNGAIMKEVKSVKEQIETCPVERQELLEEFKARLAVFEEYAPKQLSAEEIEKILTEEFAEVIASGNKGMIMKNVMPRLKGQADGKLIQEVVGKLCK